MGLTQNFESVVDSDDLSEIEVIEEIQNKLWVIIWLMF